MRRTVRWSAWDGAEHGLEHLDLRVGSDRIAAAGVVVGAVQGDAFGLSYALTLGPDWRLRGADLATTAGDRLVLAADGQGRWRDGQGGALPELDGCLDLDIMATPFTNTLPIRRLRLAEAESRAIRVAYVALPDLDLRAVDQRYTALDPGRRYRFASLDSDFTADLPVDEDGLVLDYPGLFRRVRV